MTRSMAGLCYAPPGTESSGGSDLRTSFRAAFEQAKAAHASGEPVVHAETDDDDDLEDDPAEDDADDDPDDDPAEQGDPETGAPPKVLKGKAAEAAAVPPKAAGAKSDEDALLTDAEFTALQTKHANDPAALRKDLEKAFTQKTQRVAAERRSLARLGQYEPFIDALEEDPEHALVSFAKANGIDLGKLAPPAAAAATAETEATVEEMVTEFKTALGPELDYLGDALAPAVKTMVERLLAKSVTKEVAPLKAATRAVQERHAAETTDAIMKAFEQAHPDWKTHDAAMTALAQKLDPKDMTEAEYLEHLYKVATRDAWEADREANIEREVVGRLKKHTQKLNTAESGERPAAAVPESQVRKRPAGGVSFRQAYKDAKAGITYDDGDDDE